MTGKNLLPEKEDFYSHLNLEYITDANIMQAKGVCKGFEIKKLDKYHDLYIQSNTLLLADVFNNSWYMCLDMYEFDAAHFFPEPGVAWQASVKNQSKIRSIN